MIKGHEYKCDRCGDKASVDLPNTPPGWMVAEDDGDGFAPDLCELCSVRLVDAMMHGEIGIGEPVARHVRRFTKVWLYGDGIQP